MKESDVAAKVQRALSPARFAHVQGVVSTAAELALRHGVNVEQARLAAWLHDYAREWPPERLLAVVEKMGLPEEMMVIPELWHGPVAAHLAVSEFGIADEDIHNAVFYHTTGRIGMSRLECVLCLADAVEPTRRYPQVEHLRELARRDLTRALAESFDATIQYLIVRHAAIYPGTVAARNDLWRQVQATGNTPPHTDANHV
ncbi:bis(5'-nucleosyl)-tetraphosphatase (symmetrical) YqeK [Alicyclobacillus kakegawensis]|uniref:bis(5'-nucleosyl)-tetraphosphatase (symmetrical) YqeK n=1 Tax=Alicyclobacillus kakegawensis TaxID=392012 RepID=UPI00082D5A11|nr:bis(5'-nucleosyl)-tetraphosphatase (symmetrical) YqeK [Alicyclobacillus kakegawensis]